MADGLRYGSGVVVMSKLIPEICFMKGFTLIELLASVVILGAVCVGIGYAAKLSSSPDDAVFRAAKTMTNVPIVSNGSFAWWGCSSGDLMRYEVEDGAGNPVGYVCKGLTKGATPRF